MNTSDGKPLAEEVLLSRARATVLARPKRRDREKGERRFALTMLFTKPPRNQITVYPLLGSICCETTNKTIKVGSICVGLILMKCTTHKNSYYVNLSIGNRFRNRVAAGSVHEGNTV